MPRTPAFTPKPAIEKLPLATRKDIRDNFEARVQEFEGQIEELLGKPFAIKFNPNEIWAYNKEGSGFQAGSILSSYSEGFVYTLKSFIEKYGDDGKTYFNEAVTNSELSLNVNELGDNAPTISADVKDGVFRILFKHDSLGYNASYLGEELLKAIEQAPREGFSLVAKDSSKKYWEESVDELTAQIAEIIALPDVKLDPNFDEAYKALTVKTNKDWEVQFGRAITDYFTDGLKWQLERQGFKGDDMLQEGLTEALTSKTIKFRIVSKLKQGYNEAVIEDGVLYLQTTPDTWYSNVSEMGSGIIDLL